MQGLMVGEWYPWRFVGLGLEAEYGQSGGLLPQLFGPSHTPDYDRAGSIRARATHRWFFGGLERYGIRVAVSAGVTFLHHQKVWESKTLKEPDSYDCGLDPFCDEWETQINVNPPLELTVLSGGLEVSVFKRWSEIELGLAMRGTSADPAYTVVFGPYVAYAWL